MNSLAIINRKSVEYVEINADNVGQRLDNFLLQYLKKVPKSHIYRIIRKGEVRVNKKRKQPVYRLVENDEIRIPPINLLKDSENKIKIPKQAGHNLLQQVIYEDDYLLVINKPAGLAVHSGSGIAFGVIDILRDQNHSEYLELVHRLDRDTSGILLLAKKRQALVKLHSDIKLGNIKKQYLALVAGKWPKKLNKIELALNVNGHRANERVVSVDKSGKPSITTVQRIKQFQEFTLLLMRPITGRTHQLRVHASHMGHPIVGDPKYGSVETNNAAKLLGINRLFLHSHTIRLTHPVTGKIITLTADIDLNSRQLLEKLQ